jgi:predicted transcriptional regulator
MIEKVKTEIELMQRHIEVLRTVVSYQPIGIMKLSELLDLPFHRIRYSLRVLEQMGYIRASPNGAVATAEAVHLLNHLNEEIDDMVSLLEGMKKESEQTSFSE